MGSVFISYRREDTEGQARALFQDLENRLGENSVFMDVNSIALGRDFREVLQERLATCDLMLVLIGKHWLDDRNESGRRRLEDPGDFVRLEIAAALKRDIPVTPLLLQGAQMPTVEQLPEGLSDLAYRNGFELSHSRWESDVRELIKRLGLVERNAPLVDENAKTAATISRSAERSRFPIAATMVILITVAAGGFLYYKQSVQGEFELARDTRTTVTSDKASVKTKTWAPDSVVKRGSQKRTHNFDPSAFLLKIDKKNYYESSPFTVDNLNPGEDFQVEFQVKSTRNGGSTRYGIAWNYSPDDFLLFTIHSEGSGYYSIGPGRSRTYTPFSRFSEGPISLNGQNRFDNLKITKIGTALVFAINGKDVWRTTSYRLNSNRFAFWVADFSEALIKSYSVYQ